MAGQLANLMVGHMPTLGYASEEMSFDEVYGSWILFLILLTLACNMLCDMSIVNVMLIFSLHVFAYASIILIFINFCRIKRENF